MISLRRITEFSSYAVAGITLVLMPKCPACVAAYVALFTGLWLSLSIATSIWWFLVIGCMASLGFMTFRVVQTALRRMLGKPIEPTTIERCKCCRGSNQTAASDQILTTVSL
jgi:hypothetical protein